MFKTEEYINFLISLVEYTPQEKGPKFILLDKWLEGLLQQELPLYQYIGLTRQGTKEKIYKLFSSALINKPRAVEYNKWFLYLFKHKYCFYCGEIKSLTEFHKDLNYWCKTRRYCKICCNADNKKIYYNNPLKNKIRSDKYKAAKNNSLLPWFSKQHYLEILALEYKRKQLEKETGLKYNIDHIIPIQNTIVCGLHLPINLQILTKSENCSKHNIFNQEEFSYKSLLELKSLGL